MARFAEALESNPAPTALGDIALRYEPSMLIGETLRQPRTGRPSFSWVSGLALLVLAVGSLVLGGSDVLSAGLVLGGAAAMALAVWFERLEKRQRRFVANFAMLTLRLDFASPIAGYPRTMIVDFDDVKALELATQADGALCVLVDFIHRDQALREVLAAQIPPAQRPQAERLERVLRGAFGLGAIPSDSPLLANDESSFEP